MRLAAVFAALASAHCVDGPLPPSSSTASTDNAADSRHVPVHCVLVQEDYDDDGLVDTIWRRRFNASDEILFEATDQAADGVDEIVAEHTYVGERWFTDTAYDLDGDGVLQAHGFTEQILVNAMMVQSWLDTDGDGVYESELTTDHTNPAGDPVAQTWTVTGAEPRAYVHTYDAARRWLSWTIDQGQDGSIDWARTMSYRADLEVVATDSDGDGVEDERRETHLDAEGRITMVRTDAPLGAPWEVVEAYEYGANGLEEVVVTRVRGGTRTTTFVRDEAGRILERTVAEQGQEPAVSTWEWSDCGGGLTER